MIDIHHHLIYGTDDGPKDLKGSVAQAEMAFADGITHLVCTPHANGTWAFNPERNRERLEEIRERAPRELTLGLGCDFHLSPENIEDALLNPTKYSINQGRYLLVEFAETRIPETIGETFRQFLALGVVPILTHPERNPVLQDETQRMVEWIRDGCVVQITASSLNGRFGKRAHTLGWELLDKRWVHFLATDAHNLEARPPALRLAWMAVADRFGETTAERLCVENPRAVFENLPMPAQPEPEGVFDTPNLPQGLGSRLISN